jgi:cytochrome c-type biogenesis protein CcmH
MILFWTISAILVALALAFILPPLLQPPSQGRANSAKDANVGVYCEALAEMQSALHAGRLPRQQYELDREELESRLLEDVSLERQVNTATKRGIASKKIGYIVAVALPLVAFLLYVKLGNQNAFSATHLSPTVNSNSGSFVDPLGTMSPERIEQNVATLGKRLEQNPNDFQGWIMLARSYDALEKYKEASEAFERAIPLVNKDPDLLTEYAYALSIANGQMKGKPADLIQHALLLNPDSSKALALAGNAAFEAKDYHLSIVYWKKLLRSIPSDSELAQPLNERIAEATALAKIDRSK